MSSDGSWVAVGAWHDDDDDKGSDSGSVYVFDDAGMQLAKLTAADGAANYDFGWSVAISSDGSRIVVGSPGDDSKFTDSGSVYLFDGIVTAISTTATATSATATATSTASSTTLTATSTATNTATSTATSTAINTASSSALTATSTATGIMVTSAHFSPLCPLGREASLDCSTQAAIVLSVVALVTSCVLVCIVCCLCRMSQDRSEGQNTIENYPVKIMGDERANCVIEKHPPKESQEVDLHQNCVIEKHP